MSIDPLNLRPAAPFRPVDWRWEKAKLMRDDRRAALLMRHDDDEWIVKTRRFQVEYNAVRSNYDRILLDRRWPALLEAFSLHNTPQPQLAAYEVQARLLAAQPLDQISQRLSISVPALTWYEKVFFNVQDRLLNKGYIAHRVLGESLQAGLTERDYQLLWQMYGYMAGSVVLDAIIDRNYGVTKLESPGQMTEFGNDDVQHTMLLKSMVSARTMPINSYTQTLIMEIHQRFIELKQAANSGGAGDMASVTILSMLNALPWTIGDQLVLVAADDPKRIVGRLSSEIVEADNRAAELRSDELLQLSTGQPLKKAPRRLTVLPEADTRTTEGVKANVADTGSKP